MKTDGLERRLLTEMREGKKPWDNTLILVPFGDGFIPLRLEISSPSPLSGGPALAIHAEPNKGEPLEGLALAHIGALCARLKELGIEHSTYARNMKTGPDRVDLVVIPLQSKKQ